ncbi:MAG: DUF1178 family protein [Pseudomonadota bacterium]
MIKYALKCTDGHGFESWFASASAFDGLKAAGHVTCIICGTSDVEKAIMAPRVSTGKADGPTEPATTPAPAPDLPDLAKMREAVEKNATYVGGNFAREARAQFLGDKPDRPIYGEANPAEAKSLIEDGVPVAPLPFVPTRKAN